MQEISERLLDCIERNGMLIEYKKEVPERILIEDSLQFVVLLIELETEFGIVVPDEYLTTEENLTDFQVLCDMVHKFKEIK